MTLLIIFGYLVGSYLIGSIPSAYLAGCWLKGIDLRRYGSGTVSGTGVYYHVARWAVVVVGLFDVAKGALPTWLGVSLGFGLPLALAAGLAAMIGHNWPIYLDFKGGRGHSIIMGMLLVVFPWGAPWLLTTLGFGRLLRATALGALVGVATLPLLSWVGGQPPSVIWTFGAALLLTVTKRLEANRLPLPPSGAKRREALVRRLLFDRDISSREDWVGRRPD